MRHRALHSIVIFLLSWAGAYAQGKGEIQLNVSPQRGMAYVLNGKERLTNRALVLPAGEHRFAFWSPDRRILDTTLTVIADSTVAFYKTLAPTEAFLTYQAGLKRAKHKRLLYRAVPLLATVVGGVFTMNAKKENDAAYDALKSAEEEYATLRTPFIIANHKTNVLPSLQAEHDAAYRRMRLMMVGTSVVALATVWGFIRAARVEDPTYEDQEKLRFDGLVWLPGQNGGTFHAGMSYRLIR